MAENEELQETGSEGEARQKILVADDEASIRRILETRLKMVGYDVVTAEDGEEAVEVFNKTNPDLVVLDVMMPKMDGYGVTREIRRTSDVPIIILTALGDVSERITGLELGADDYVIKPFSPKELEARVKAVLRRTISKDVIIPSSSSSASGSAALHLRKSGGTTPADYHNSHNHTGPSLYNFPSNTHAFPQSLSGLPPEKG